MSAEASLAAIAGVTLLNLLLLGGVLASLNAPSLRTRFARPGPNRRPAEAQLTEPVTLEGISGANRRASNGPTSREPRYQRVFRIASWTFLLAAAVIVAASGLWPDSLAKIVILIAATGGLVLLNYELLPEGLLLPVRALLLAFVVIGFAALLVMLTGGYDSPFVVTFPLVVGAAAVVVGTVAALLLALLAIAGYLLSVTLTSGTPSIPQAVLTAVNILALFLLMYTGAAVGREQRRVRDAALRDSALDALTGLYNRTFFFAALEHEIARSERSGRGFCVLMLDVDLLKEFNDRLGHHAGDAVLRAVAEAVRSRVRKIDVASRYGGDEFAILLPETDPTGGWVTAERIRVGVKDRETSALELRPTVSVGVVTYPADGRTADALMANADRAMYSSKRGGKDRVRTTATIATMEPTNASFEPEPSRGLGEHTG